MFFKIEIGFLYRFISSQIVSSSDITFGMPPSQTKQKKRKKGYIDQERHHAFFLWTMKSPPHSRNMTRMVPRQDPPGAPMTVAQSSSETLPPWEEA